MRDYDKEIRELAAEKHRVSLFLGVMPEDFNPDLLINYETQPNEFIAVHDIDSLAQMIAVYKWYLENGLVAECEKRKYGGSMSFENRNAPQPWPEKAELVAPFRIELQRAVTYNVTRMVWPCEIENYRFSVVAQTEGQLPEAWIDITTYRGAIKRHSLMVSFQGCHHDNWGYFTKTVTPMYVLYWPYGTDIDNIL